MALTQRLELRQSHALVMTPQLMQAIKLLQLSNLELASYVEGELERNPLLQHLGEGEADSGQASAGDAGTGPGESIPSTRAEQDRPGDERGDPESEDFAPADGETASARSNGEDL